ncbi:glutathione S-transferase family protein [Methylocella silvestris]|uniref:Glutathione S-transferase n=1 Tax=Methylocella silvestris TaxID=199596 RepID=A0A2J7TEM8_METSI|nr:glutathione S-transferase family protein [Methylocella silvestris]PNG25222.1 glutathione S-transferase [Methylocella silvestris]
MTYTLLIANKSYSSWSFRPWILLRHFGVAFDEIIVPLSRPDTKEQILRFSPAGKCPALRDGDLLIWDSLAIIEYVAEGHPDLPIWPRGREARAQARSLSAEMHSGFMGVRSHLPMNFRRKVGERGLTEEARGDVARIEAAFAAAREKFGAGGPFLFGAFSAADAMFAPVVSRLHSYAVPVTPQTRAYMDAVMALPAWRDWSEGALAEPWPIEKYDRL